MKYRRIYGYFVGGCVGASVVNGFLNHIGPAIALGVMGIAGLIILTQILDGSE